MECKQDWPHVGEPVRRSGGDRRSAVRRLCAAPGDEDRCHRTAVESLGPMGTDPSDSSSWSLPHAGGGNRLATRPVGRGPRRSSEDGGVACQRRGPSWPRAATDRGACHGAAWFKRPVPGRRTAPRHRAGCRSLPLRWAAGHRRRPHARDCAALLDQQGLNDLVDAAIGRNLTSYRRITAAWERAGKVRGGRLLEAAISPFSANVRLGSEMEALALRRFTEWGGTTACMPAHDPGCRRTVPGQS